ncbi:MAG: DUF4126 domain-containing protein [Planctomycetes bacterium]|nr:DUF4126 domain-containing protein [Planctomycetota bacterium]
MSLPAVLYTLSSVPIFASRPFLAAFVTALLARFGTELPWIGDNSIVVALSASPEWFQSTTCIAVLGFWALLEVLSAKSPEVRQVLEQVDGLVKTAVAMLVSFAVIDADTARTIGAIQKAGLSFDSAWALVIGASTWLAAGLRRKAVELVIEADEGDDIGLQSLLAWAENSWAVLGILFLVIFPLAALVLSLLTTLGIWLVRRRAAAREERAKVPCAGCQTPLRPHATRCHGCQHEVAAPRAVGVFGQPKERATDDRTRHAFDLVARKRCPVCASRLAKCAVQQACPTCTRVTFASPAEFERYLDVLAARLPKTLLVSLGLGAIPLLGVIPGVIYYRLNLVAGLRGYIPPLRGCTTRWIVRVIHLAVIVLQPIPVLGALVLPFMCWSTYAIYRRSLAGRAREELAAPARA